MTALELALGWWDGPLAALDFEATTPEPETARPVSVALVVEHRGEIARHVVELIDCGCEIPVDSVAVHGITRERVLAEGVPVGPCLERLRDQLAMLAAARVPLVIMNARFDWPLLRNEAARQRIAVPDMLLLDPAVIDRHVDKYRRGSRRLADLAAYYDVVLTAAHDAAADATAAIAVTRAVARRFPALQMLSVEQLSRAHTQWFESWRVGINAFWARKGDASHIEPGWPFPQIPEPAEAR